LIPTSKAKQLETQVYFNRVELIGHLGNLVVVHYQPSPKGFTNGQWYICKC
jgi:hypothetical protein